MHRMVISGLTELPRTGGCPLQSCIDHVPYSLCYL